jgi:hypothetical protein
MDGDLRNSLWSGLIIYFWREVSDYNYSTSSKMVALVQALWLHYFKKPFDMIPYSWSEILQEIRDYFFEADWDEVYDFIEFVANNYNYEYITQQFISGCNAMLEQEVSAYRFVGTQITRITSEEEINAIDEALAKSTPLKPVYTHLKTALGLFSDRKAPDYRNSIKESISAVEAMSRLVTGNPKATLGEAIKRIKEKVELHPALEKAFASLYGYTSDEEGVRHSLMKDSNLKFADAKYMLVSCSAFINFLIEKSEEANIKLS